MTEERKDQSKQPEPEAKPPVDVLSEQAADQSTDAGTDPVEALRRDRDDLFARLQRVSADYQNYIRRSQQQQADAVDFAVGDALKSFIPALDLFDRALGEKAEDHPGLLNLLSGVRMVRDELIRLLRAQGVEQTLAAPGDPFDPHQHAAMVQLKAPGVAPGHVAAMLQPGYRFKTRVLRPVQVAVAPPQE